MGRLITLSDFQTTRDSRIPIIDASWYFEDARWSSESDRYHFNWPSPNFPHMLYIHNDHLYPGYNYDDNSPGQNKIKIRRWVESAIPDVVIRDAVDMNYRKYYGKTHDWDSGYDIRNTWSRFSFENGESATMFALVFVDLVATPTRWHPDHPEDEEYLKTLKSRN